MRLFLIRHGQTPANVLGQLDTAHPGPGLTELGSRQASVIPDALRRESIDAIYASTLVRTQLTAEPLAVDRGLDVQVATGLHEIEAGALEGRSDRASVHSYFETVLAWGTGDLTARMPEGLDGNSFFTRFDADIASAAAGADTAAVFSHGAAIRVWTAARAVNVSPMFAGTTDLENTGMVELSGSPGGGWTLVSWAGLSVGSPGGPQLLAL
ncbi:histidine phosphatase family protein [Cryobacterium sinapicolor]|uniref:Histidine phosphatase family protein n=1 Tax=Cryobacterium sinapicolor TaxID=1259236 RepID=A0ABY2J3K0_9MICO|nr:MULTISPECIES: histidine phosphatase family protein [Cryobacterium]TFC94146.1 histidine phosphatase family protein [Cryobacterium sp. TMT3-29-2]TFC99502.1 histidine phosphatase family protein [Cryobacterium sinapicolor]